jgi:DNA-directed RNA polymerase subunit M/transcription elongation factor TFIIS
MHPKAYAHLFDPLSSDLDSDSESSNDEHDSQNISPNDRALHTIDLNSQNNIQQSPDTKKCVHCGINKELICFSLQSRLVSTTLRGTHSFRCDACRRTGQTSQNIRRRLKRQAVGDNLLIEHVNWPQMMEYFLRDVRYDQEYV